MIRKTKIIATIGPSTSSRERLKTLIQRGVTVCRLNFAHLTHAEAKRIIEKVKSINQELGTHTAILGDLQGPKIRLEDFENPIKIKETLFTRHGNLSIRTKFSIQNKKKVNIKKVK